MASRTERTAFASSWPASDLDLQHPEPVLTLLKGCSNQLRGPPGRDRHVGSHRYVAPTEIGPQTLPSGLRREVIESTVHSRPGRRVVNHTAAKLVAENGDVGCVPPHHDLGQRAGHCRPKCWQGFRRSRASSRRLHPNHGGRRCPRSHEDRVDPVGPSNGRDERSQERYPHRVHLQMVDSGYHSGAAHRFMASLAHSNGGFPCTSGHRTAKHQGLLGRYPTPRHTPPPLVIARDTAGMPMSRPPNHDTMPHAHGASR
jgi:hypothetical protein